ncbi:hypothetical protein ACJDU8_03480 [Clostridium sp. WILCCON 0269]|uniref:Uncharacterized protein n=1 Tax=Candidatus Clostridium eludens TaxID=3381663 RepID=A0ABW8SFV3_9CLOT
MRDPNRIKPFLGKIEGLWLKYPDLRFGQLISIIASEMGTRDIFFPEEPQWLEAVQKVIDKSNKRENQ